MKKKTWTLVFFLLSSLIGAGFASGKEIATFFAHYGYFSIFLSMLSAVFFYMLCKFFLFSGKSEPIANFGEVFKRAAPKHYKILNALLLFSFVVMIGTMIAGANAIGKILLPHYTGYYISFATIALAQVVVVIGLKAMHKINWVIIPVTVVLILLVCVASFFPPEADMHLRLVNLEVQDYFMGIGSALLYVCLNILSLGLLLMQIGGTYAAKEIKRASLYFSIIVGVLLIFVSVALINSKVAIYNSEMPLLALAQTLRPAVFYVMCLIIYLSILTTIISDTFMLSFFVQKFVKKKGLAVFLILFCAFFVSIIGFGNIVKYIYPLMGIFGLFFVLVSLRKSETVKVKLKVASTPKKIKNK